jgi:phage portal protein BeeE
MIRTYTVAGDAFAEIIRDEDGVLINLKPLDPSSIVIVQNRHGRIKRYEQVVKNKTPNKRFRPDQILHLSRKRIADNLHGISVVPSVQFIINARNEAMADWKRVLHRNVDPLWIFHLDTDDTAQINSFKTKMDAARAGGENMYIPKGAVVPELVTTATNATLLGHLRSNDQFRLFRSDGQ